MLTDEKKVLRGDEEIAVRGVELALKKDTDRMRQLEYLQLTANEIDQQIVGIDGRAAILRTLADNLGLPGDQIVPTSEDLKARQEAEAEQAQAAAAQADGDQKPRPGSTGAGRQGEATDNLHRTGVS